MPNLLDELHSAASNVRQRDLDRIRALGIDVAWLADCPVYPFGVVGCERSGGGLYQPAPDAPKHMVVPVLEAGELVDLVAFRSDDPGNWMLRTGAGWALGVETGFFQEVTHLHATPLDWLRADGAGLCVLDWGASDIARLDALPAVTTGDADTAKLLKVALTRPLRLPNISIVGGIC